MLRAQAHAGQGEFDKTRAPFQVWAYSQDQTEHVSLSVVVFRNDAHNPWTAQLTVNRSKGAPLLLITDVPAIAIPQLSVQLDKLKPGVGQFGASTGGAQLYAHIFGARSQGLSADTFNIIRFALPDSAVFKAKDSISARLPVIAPGEVPFPSGPSFGLSGASSDTNLGHLLDVAFYSTGTKPGDVDARGFDANQAPTVPLRSLFWQPASVSTSEIIRDVGPQLLGSNLKINFPAIGTVENGDFVWQGGADLAPQLSAIASAVDDRRGSEEFLSGIAFAVAAATMVALVQERPGAEKRTAQDVAGMIRDEIRTELAHHQRGEDSRRTAADTRVGAPKKPPRGGATPERRNRQHGH